MEVMKGQAREAQKCWMRTNLLKEMNAECVGEMGVETPTF